MHFGYEKSCSVFPFGTLSKPHAPDRMPPKGADTAKAAAKPKSRKAPAGDGTEKVPKKAKPNKGKKKQKVRSEVIDQQI